MNVINTVIYTLAVMLLTSCSLAPHCSQLSAKPLKLGESRTLEVQSNKLWNDTAIIVEPGAEYAFSVSNRAVWYDAGISSTANGYSRTLLVPFILLRRDIGAPWFALICSVDFKDKFRVFDDSSCFEEPPMQACADRFRGPQKTCTQLHGDFTRPGTLYCFANDLSVMYGNNSGAIEITVTKMKEF